MKMYFTRYSLVYESGYKAWKKHKLGQVGKMILMLEKYAN